MSANTGSIQHGNHVFNTSVIAVLAMLLWTVDGKKVIPTTRDASCAAALIGVILIVCLFLKKARQTINDPAGSRKDVAMAVVVVGSFVLAAVGWVVVKGWDGYAPRHAFAGMVVVLALIFVRRNTLARKDKPAQEGNHPDESKTDGQPEEPERELADTSA